MRSLLVTGTDTGVGKTHVSCALLRALRAAGVRVAAMKPCETGLERPVHEADDAHDDLDGVSRAASCARRTLPPGSDAALLHAASGSTADAADVRPYAFHEPSAPLAAARAEGRTIDPQVLDASFFRLAATHEVVLVEGAGGLLVPLTETLDFAGLALRWSLPLLVVARTGLGTLNHTALTVRAARAAGLDVLGVVTNSVDGPVSDSDRSNLGLLAELLDGVPLLAELPHGGSVAHDAHDRSLAHDVLAPLLSALGVRAARA